jgi:MYXO-CTERM domain-containing protein
VDPQVPGGTPISTGNPNGGGTGTGTGTGTSGGTTKPETKATDDGAHESAACSLGHAPASNGALAMLAMLGALFGLKRRRN